MPKPDAAPQKMQSFWDAHSAEIPASFDWSQRRFAEAMLPHVRGKAVLDCGCGHGTLSAMLADAGADVLGLDFSQAMIDRAHANFPHLTFRQADVLGLHLNRHFDVICGSAFLHEIDAARTPELIEFFDRHLARGGFGWFQENSFFNPIARLLRNHVVGRYGVPKVGSADETPFDARRWQLYRSRFEHAVRSAEAFVTFSRLHGYFVRVGSAEPWHAADRLVSAVAPDFLKRNFSYIQHIYFSHDRPKNLS